PSISDGRLSYQFSSDGYIRRSVYAYLDLNSEVYQREKTHHHQYARNKALLAFMICGVEQAYIREVVSMNPGRVCMLDHDGVVATGALSLPDWRGFTMKVKD
ncbi:hypothetical protein RNO15_19450, partial [Escherichia coli]|nr:hypothetical protein [Escherichia coli]